MKQPMFTTREFRPVESVADASTGVDTLHAEIQTRIDNGLPQVACPEMQLDTLADAITSKARAAMSAARDRRAERWLISPFDEDGYSTFFEPVPVMLTVLRVAVQIEPDPVEAGLWYRRTCIAELGSLTAAQLVSQGRSDEVIGFLLSVRDGERD